ncbi:hypothetical protein [Streptomyces violarus]|uniref:Uncharacterized protein n=1 Tax=Streptomyces violarus TaxID=67380 RepID=A0A7W4ZLB3_9ACTN|nr:MULTISPECIES: hypothetical protein [Streptomyces]MBB3074615.1 hypothetical protein [Streptomyces violarus]WRT97289.1 hypothetical protein VJ737_06155 [Streptomyces sp. CGMCC 4.1772]
MRGHLKKAGAAADEDFGWRRAWSGSAAREGVWSNIRSAEVMLLQLVSDEEVAGRASEVMALVKDHLETDDPRRVRLARRLRSIISGEISPSDRDLMVRALDAAYNALDDELARVRSLRNILWTATFVVLLGVAGLAVYGWFFPQSLSLCFTPKVEPGNASGIDVVCPTAEHRNVPVGTASSLAQPRDILTVEIAGLAGAALTVIASLRRIRGTDSPYMLPLASAVLKFPTGALSAFLGLLLIRGAFVPGLSDLDSRAQVLGWAAAFGAAQHLVTRLVDERAQMTLEEVGRPTDAANDPERAAVKEIAAEGEPAAPGPQAAAPSGNGEYEGPLEGPREGTGEEEREPEPGRPAGS